MKKEKMPMALLSYAIPSKDIKISKVYLTSDGWRWYIDVADYGWVISNAPGYESYTKDGYKNDLGYEKNFEEAYQWLLDCCERNGWTLKEVGTSDEGIVLNDEECEKITKYLKWEDLETDITYYGLLNGVKIRIDLFPPHSTDNHEWEVRLIKDNGYWVYIKEQDKEFFDDLHLEEVE